MPLLMLTDQQGLKLTYHVGFWRLWQV